jgi:hypothetical protein
MTKSKGHTYYELTPEELAKWKDFAKQVHLDWVKENGAIGQRLYDELQILIAETPAMTPPPAAPPPAAAPPSGPPPATVEGVVNWKDALGMTNFGATVTVNGVAIDSMSFMPPEAILFIGDAGGDAMASFPVNIPDPSKGFPDLATYKGKTLEVTGQLAKNNFTGKAQMNISSPDQIKIK